MDKITKYRSFILKILKEYQPVKYSNIDAENVIIADKENDRYQLVTMGWKRYKRIHACTLHFDIIDGKIWVQSDQTERGIANRLVEMGVPKSDIVLAYFTPRIREDTGFAIA